MNFYIFYTLSLQALCTNFIINGGFDAPVVPTGYNQFLQVAKGWDGSFFDLMGSTTYRTLGHGQYADLARDSGN